jgi:hypothetical protein
VDATLDKIAINLDTAVRKEEGESIPTGQHGSDSFSNVRAARQVVRLQALSRVRLWDGEIYWLGTISTPADLLML